MTSDTKQQYPEPEMGRGTGAARARVIERRANPRYDLVVEFELFHLWGAKHLIWAGTGKTRNWSRNSILIDWEQALPEGASVELVVKWTAGVQLVVIGRVLHAATRGTVVRILRRRFRGKPEIPEIPRDARSAPPPPGQERAS